MHKVRCLDNYSIALLIFYVYWNAKFQNLLAGLLSLGVSPKLVDCRYKNKIVRLGLATIANLFYALYSMHCILCIVFSELYSMHFLLCIFNASYSKHCIPCIILYSFYRIQFLNSMHFPWCIVLYSLFSAHCILCIVVYALYVLHFIFCILCYALFDMHC